MTDALSIIMIDHDGTFTTGSELRNRDVLQSIVDTFREKAEISQKLMIDWSIVAGQAETRIYDWIVNNLFPGMRDLITSSDFRDMAKAGYDSQQADCTPRNGMIQLLKEFGDKGIPTCLVSNSDKFPIHDSLERGVASNGHCIDTLFPIIVTADEIRCHGKKKKPSGDPYRLALELYNKKFGTNFTPDQLAILEDSPTGAEAGLDTTGKNSRVIQFVDYTPPSDSAGHHIRTVPECRDILLGLC